MAEQRGRGESLGGGRERDRLSQHQVEILSQSWHVDMHPRWWRPPCVWYMRLFGNPHEWPGGAGETSGIRHCCNYTGFPKDFANADKSRKDNLSPVGPL
jgi:hypothetical protein